VQRGHDHERDLVRDPALHQSKQVVAGVAGQQDERREHDDDEAQSDAQRHTHAVDRDEWEAGQGQEWISSSHEDALHGEQQGEDPEQAADLGERCAQADPAEGEHRACGGEQSREPCRLAPDDGQRGQADRERHLGSRVQPGQVQS